MTSTRGLAELADHVECAQGNSRSSAIHRQLPELQRAVYSGRSSQRGLALELTENLRQEQQWERNALDNLRMVEQRRPSESYGKHGRLVVERTAAVTPDRPVRGLVCGP